MVKEKQEEVHNSQKDNLLSFCLSNVYIFTAKLKNCGIILIQKLFWKDRYEKNSNYA